MSLPDLSLRLRSLPALIVRQRHELAELIGFESRNKYVIEDEAGNSVGFAAEQQKGFIGFLLRQVLGHWRRFSLQIFDHQKQPMVSAVHPFRWIFQRLEVTGPEGVRIGAIQQRFGIFTKSFDVEDEHGRISMQVRSGLFSFWTFIFERNGREVARVEKKWSGLVSELFTDRDTFRILFVDPSLSDSERLLLLASGLFIDLQYFERKARN